MKKKLEKKQKKAAKLYAKLRETYWPTPKDLTDFEPLFSALRKHHEEDFPWQLWPAQQAFLRTPNLKKYPNLTLDVCVYQGGYGSGKTYVGALLGIGLSMQHPGIQGMVVGKTYPLIQKTTLKTYFELFNDMGWEAGEDYVWRATESKIIFPKWVNA